MSVSQIKTGAIISYISIGINLLIGLLYTPWMIRSIGKENYGLYVLATSIISLFVFDFGLGNAVTRFVSKYIAECKLDKINNFLGQITKLYLSLDVFFLLILTSVYFFIPDIYRELSSAEIEKFKVIYAIAACYSVISFPFIPLNGILTAYEKFIQLKLCDLFNKIFIVITMAICLLNGYGLYALVLVNAISGIITIILKLVILKQKTFAYPNLKYKNNQEFREVASYSGWVTITALAQRLIFNIAPTILGMVAGSAEIALFGIASTFEAYVFTFANVLNGLFLPRVTQVTVKDENGILPLMVKVGRIQILIIGLLIIGFIAIGKDFLNLWLGNDFESAYISILFLIIPSFFYLPQLIGSNAVLAQNKVKKQAIVFSFMGLFNLVVGYFLSKMYGAIGFSVSIFMAYTIRTIGMDIIFKKDLNIDVISFFKQSFISMSPALIIATVIAVGLCFFKVDSWLLLFAKAVIITLIYICLFLVFCLNKTEKSLFIDLFRR